MQDYALQDGSSGEDNMSRIDKLALLRGNPYVINDKISILQPTLDEVEKFGNENFLALVATITATSYDFRFRLDDANIDYEDVDDFTMFTMLVSALTNGETKILFGDLDFESFQVELDEENEYFFLKNKDGVIIDTVIYQLIVDYLRAVHGLKRHFIHFGNEMARKFHMEDERRLLEEQKSKETNEGTWLEPLISAMVNCDNFKYSYENVWQLTFYQFMDAVKRIQKINESQNVSMGIYTGNIDTEKMGQTKLREQLNWLGEL